MGGRRHRIRNAAATLAILALGVVVPLTITKGSRISGGNSTLVMLWAVFGASSLIWFASTDLVVRHFPLRWIGFNPGEASTALQPQVESDPIRVALFAVRSELGACATRIVEAQAASNWWDPDTDPLPAQAWKAHFQALTLIPDDLNAVIDITYQKCDRLNHLSRYYIEERKRATPLAIFKPGPTQLNDHDKERLASALKRITETNRAISEHLAKPSRSRPLVGKKAG